MADVYIDDSGSYERDALFVGVEDTAWSKNATDRAIWFSSTGTCTTGFTLPDSEWIVYEVYGMTGTSLTADYTTLTGSTKLQGKKEYTTTIGTVLTTLNAWRTALDKTNYTTYEIIATHYKGSDEADVYEADETTAFTTATTTDGAYTGHGSEWVLSDALLADSVTSYNTELWDSNWNATTGLYFNELTVPTTGEVCGASNFTSSASYHYMTSSIDVTSYDSILITGDGNRLVVMGKTTSDGLCRFIGNFDAGVDKVIDTSDRDYLIIYNGLGEVPEPDLSVLG